VASRERERQLARERYERQQARRAADRARARRRQQVIGAVVATLAVLGGMIYLASRLDGDENVTANPPAPSATGATAANACKPPAVAPTKPLTFAKEPPLTTKKTTYTATLTTNCGDIELLLDAAKAPRAVNSFRFLAEKGYFDGAPCHRLTTEGIFVLQCGDPTGSGSGSPGYTFADENLPADAAKNYPAGTVAMANSGPGTNGSQFFLVYQDTKLEPKYTIFGRISKGADVIEKVRAGGVVPNAPNGDGPPVQKISLTDVTVTEGEK
jgi:peptidyl-prolyl cis-trans isomerase B (cyclophilin B)